MTEYVPFPVQRKTAPGESPVGKYCSYLWANDWKHAKAVAAERRIGETVVGRCGRNRSSRPYQLPSELLKKRMTPKQKINFIHACCFMSFLLMRSTGADAHGICGDEGLLHQAIHCAAGLINVEDMRHALLYFERRIPGYK